MIKSVSRKRGGFAVLAPSGENIFSKGIVTRHEQTGTPKASPEDSTTRPVRQSTSTSVNTSVNTNTRETQRRPAAAEPAKQSVKQQPSREVKEVKAVKEVVDHNDSDDDAIHVQKMGYIEAECVSVSGELWGKDGSSVVIPKMTTRKIKSDDNLEINTKSGYVVFNKLPVFIDIGDEENSGKLSTQKYVDKQIEKAISQIQEKMQEKFEEKLSSMRQRFNEELILVKNRITTVDESMERVSSFIKDLGEATSN